MSIKEIIVILLCVSLTLPMVGCSSGADYGQYAQAVKEQNITRQLQLEVSRREKDQDQRKHEEKMALLAGNLVMAASKTASPNDDMMVPLVIMMMEDKWSMAKLAAQANEPRAELATIKAPETTSQKIAATTGIILGVGALALAGFQSKQLADVATAGLNAAGTHTNINGSGNEVANDSYKSGTDNVVSGDESSVIGGSVDGCTDCGEESVSRYYDDAGQCRVSPTCSCASYDAGLCSV